MFRVIFLWRLIMTESSSKIAEVSNFNIIYSPLISCKRIILAIYNWLELTLYVKIDSTTSILYMSNWTTECSQDIL